MDIKENQMQSYFKACDVFGVDPYNKIDIEEVRNKYRNYAKIYHPDINKSKEAVDQMVVINKAFTFFKNNIDDLDDFTYYANYFEENGETPHKQKNINGLNQKLKYNFIGWSNFFLTIVIIIMLTGLLVNSFFNYEYKYLITMIAFGGFLLFYYIMMFMQGNIYNSALFYVINIITIIALGVYIFLLVGDKL